MDPWSMFCPLPILMCLFIVCESKFTIGESRTISHANDTQAQQVTLNPRPGRFSTETPLERERRLPIQREQRRRRRQQETVEQKEHRLAQRRQRRQQETEEQEIGIRGIMIVHCRKPIPADIICRSKSEKFQLCITDRTIIIFQRTTPGQICSLFLSFSKSGRRNNAKSAFQYTVNNNTTYYAKKKKKKKTKNNVWFLRRYSRLVTHPVLNPVTKPSFARLIARYVFLVRLSNSS